MRKAQLYGQIFTYILTIILASFILIYGYNAIVNFKSRAEQISCLKFRNDLSSAVEGILSDFGSVKRKDLELCNNYKQVCFVETFESFDRQNPQGKNQQGPINIDPIIKDSISSNSGKNVFLVENIAKESFYIGNISVDSDVFCVPVVDNKISLRLEGKGNHVLLSQWG